MNQRIIVSDGSSWPRPAMESDDRHSPAWRARYAEDTLSRSDLLTLASIADAYGYLIAESTREKRDLVCRDIRASLLGESE